MDISDTTLGKDLQEKRLIYAKAGIREYWVIDLEKKQLRGFQNIVNNDYQKEEIYSKG